MQTVTGYRITVSGQRANGETISRTVTVTGEDAEAARRYAVAWFEGQFPDVLRATITAVVIEEVEVVIP